MISLIKLLPVVIGMIVGGSGVAALMKYTAPKIEPCPACNCSCPPQTNAIDIEKLKNFKGRFTIEQHYQVNSDSMFTFHMEQVIKKELERLKIARCR